MIANQFNKHKVRIVLGLLSAALLLLVWVDFTRLWTSPNDENWFTTNVYSLSIAKGFPAKSLNQSSEQQPKGIEVGDLIVSLDHEELKTVADLQRKLDSLSNFQVFDLTIFRPRNGRRLAFKVARQMIPKDFVRPIPPSVYVLHVTDGGASDRAGMQRGDLIIRIDGQGFENAKQADLIMRTTRAGQSVRYDVLRANRLLTLDVTMATFGIPMHLMVIRICGLLFMVFGAFLWLARPNIKAARINGIAFTLMGAGLASLMPDRTSSYFPSSTLTPWVRWALLTLGGAALIHGRYYFPRELPQLLSRGWPRYFPYFLALVLAAVGVWLGHSVFFPIMLVMAGYQLAIIRVFGGTERTSARESQWLNAATWFALTAIAVFTLLPTMRVNYIGHLGIPLLVLPLAYLYVMMRFGLLDLQIRVRKTVQYSAASLGWLLLLVIAFGVLLRFAAHTAWDIPNIHFSARSIEILESPMAAPQRAALEKKLLMLLAVVTAWMLLRFGRWGQRLIDLRFHRSGYDYRRATSELSESLSRKLSLDELTLTIVDKLCELMYLKESAMIVLKEEKWVLSARARGIDESSFAEFLDDGATPLAEALSPFFGEVANDYLPLPVKTHLRGLGITYVVPIRSKNSLLAMLLVGEKLSESPIEQEDLRFIDSTSKQVAMCLENALLYERLADQERWRHELEIARQIQLSSLPQTTPNISGLSISAVSEPAMEVGGDYFDYLPDERRLMVIVGDVSGKGTSAALHMSKLQGVLRSLHTGEDGPAELLSRANPILCQNMDAKSFVTALAVQFDPLYKTCLVARAGHLPLFHFRASNGTVECHAPAGLALAVRDGHLFRSLIQELPVTYEEGDVFVLVSDGVTEAFNEQAQAYGEKRLMQVLASCASASAAEIEQQLMLDVAEFAAERDGRHDDMTVMVIKATPIDVASGSQAARAAIQTA